MVKINKNIFRSYDIRGIVDKDLNFEVVKLIGKAIGTYIHRRLKADKKNIKTPRIYLGYDCRLSSPEYRDALIHGLVSTNCTVKDIGEVPTPVFYFTMHTREAEGGVMITGSHNPKEFNGFKINYGTHSLFGDEIMELYRIIESEKFVEGQGNWNFEEVVDDYIEAIKKRTKIIKPLKVAVDAGNGTAGPIILKILKNYPVKVIDLFCEPDGNFPNHHPDPTVPENVQTLIKTVKSEKCDVGIGYDGDADRLAAVTNSGRLLYGDELLIVFAKDILSRHKTKIVYEVKCSRAVEEKIREYGGEPVMFRTGHSWIKGKMKEENALLAGEMSGHIFIADDYYGYDDAIFASCRLLQILSYFNGSFDDLVSEIPNYPSTPEIRIPFPDEKKFQVVKEITEEFKKENYKVIDVDGVRIEFDEGWGLLRASNTQPVLVLRFEAKTENDLNRIKNIILSKLKEFAPELDLNL